jgi:hypothetical protein
MTPSNGSSPSAGEAALKQAEYEIIDDPEPYYAPGA